MLMHINLLRFSVPRDFVRELPKSGAEMWAGG